MQTKFFTGEGDLGVSHVSGKAYPKNSLALEVLGTLDELNTFLGLCRALAFEQDTTSIMRVKHKEIQAKLYECQNFLFILQAHIATLIFGGSLKHVIKEVHSNTLEVWIKEIDDEVPPIKNFIVPGGFELSARVDVARAVTRRLERLLVALSNELQISSEAVQFINRLSSFLFALARYINYLHNINEEKPDY